MGEGRAVFIEQARPYLGKPLFQAGNPIIIRQVLPNGSEPAFRLFYFRKYLNPRLWGGVSIFSLFGF